MEKLSYQPLYFTIIARLDSCVVDVFLACLAFCFFIQIHSFVYNLILFRVMGGIGSKVKAALYFPWSFSLYKTLF